METVRPINVIKDALGARHKAIINLQLTVNGVDTGHLPKPSQYMYIGIDESFPHTSLVYVADSVVRIDREKSPDFTASILKSPNSSQLKRTIPFMSDGPVIIQDGIKAITDAFSMPDSPINIIIGYPGYMKTRLSVLAAIEMTKPNDKLVIFDTDESITMSWLRDITDGSVEWPSDNIILVRNERDAVGEIREIIQASGDDTNYTFIIDNGSVLNK